MLNIKVEVTITTTLRSLETLNMFKKHLQSLKENLKYSKDAYRIIQMVQFVMWDPPYTLALFPSLSQDLPYSN